MLLTLEMIAFLCTTDKYMCTREESSDYSASVPVMSDGT